MECRFGCTGQDLALHYGWYRCTPQSRALRAEKREHYLPLFAEQRCGNCGFWRGQHDGYSSQDAEMLCPPPATTTYVGVGICAGRSHNRGSEPWNC